MLEIRSFRDVLRLLFIFKREVKIAIVSTLIIAILGAFFLPLKFESEARLLVKTGRANSIMSIDAANRQPLISPTTVRDPIIDEEKMLTRPYIVKKVAEKYLALMENSPPPEGFLKKLKAKLKGVIGGFVEYCREGLVFVGLVDEKTLVERVSAKLKKNFTVSHEAGSSVMDVSFTWSDPFVAQEIVRLWVDFYLAERVSILSQSSTLSRFYESAKNQSANDLVMLNGQINEKLTDLDIVDFGAVFNNLTVRLNSLHESRFQAVNERDSLRAGVRESLLLHRQLRLNQQLDQLKLDLTAQLRTFKETAEPIINLKQGIKAIENKLSKEHSNQKGVAETGSTELLKTLDDTTLEKKARVKEIDALVVGYDREIARISKKLQRLLDEKPNVLKLNAELLEEEKNYSFYLGNHEKARIDYELDKERISNIVMIEAASLNPSRVFPKSLNIILASIPVSLFVAMFSLYLCYLLDQRIHDGGGIEEHFGVKFWTSLNEFTGDNAKSNSAFQANLYRIYSLLPIDNLSEKGLTIGLTSSHLKEGANFVAKHLQELLEEQGVEVVNDEPVSVGQVRIVSAPNLLNDSSALVNLREADVRLLVVQAVATTVPTVEHSISILETAFEKVDGIILNRRKFEVPLRLLKYFSPKVG